MKALNRSLTSKFVFVFVSFLFLLGMEANASGYNHSLYLCDLGIRSVNTANQLGVDFIQYLRNGRTSSVAAMTQFSNSLSLETSLNPAFNRWDPTSGIDNVSINLESDYYGSQYYLEYCYTWDRIPPFSPNDLNYEIGFGVSLPNQIPSTNLTVDTNCSARMANGLVENSSTLQSLSALTSVSTDFVSMRCTIRLTFAEISMNQPRPHSGEAVTADPNISVGVSP